MSSINTGIMSHELKIESTIQLVAQKRRALCNDKSLGVTKEEGKLLDMDYFKEIHFQTWVINSILAKKTNKQWQMFVDFWDLNKECPKSAYHTRIDQLIEVTSGHKMLCFMDAYSGYDLIKMNPADIAQNISQEYARVKYGGIRGRHVG